MNVNKFLILFSIIFLLINASDVLAQKNKKQLEKEKKENLKKIIEAQKILSETAIEHKASVGQLRAINRQIKIRTSLIKSITEEIELMNGEISDLSIVVNSLQSDLVKLKEEYALMIYGAYKANRGFNKLTFLFSAKTFNQLFLRLKYLEQYAEARQTQVENIEEVAVIFDLQKSDLEVKKTEQNRLLDSKVKENKNLLSLKTKQNKVVTQLGKREKELKKELAKRKEAIFKLDKLIADIVKKEIEKTSKGTSKDKISLTAEAAKLSSSFEGNKNKLPWPVESGFIASKFGKHPHPVLKNITIENQGIDIQTRKNESVKSVFNGKVATVAFVPGMNSVVIVQHGDYYTLYAKLKSVDVKKGQEIKSRDKIGEVFTDKDGISEIQFQVWKNNVKLNPERWIFGK